MISPELPQRTADMAAQLKLTFPILWDEQSRVAEAFGLAFTLPEDLKTVYLGFGNDLAMAPAWAAAADIGARFTGVLSGTMNMMASFMAALEARWLGRLLEQHDLVFPFVLLACSYALGALAWIGVDIRKPLADV